MIDSAILGLEKGFVRLVAFRSEWGEAFNQERQRIAEVLKANKLEAAIEHIGSTAIKGMHAKPIVDIAVGLKAPNDIRIGLKALVEGASYDYVPAANRYGMIFLARGSGNLRYFHVHLTVRYSLAWNRLVKACDYLRSNVKARESYDNAKIILAKKYENSRIEYAKAKVPVVEAIVSKALLLNDYRRAQAISRRTRALDVAHGDMLRFPILIQHPDAKLHMDLARRSWPEDKKPQQKPVRK